MRCTHVADLPSSVTALASLKGQPGLHLLQIDINGAVKLAVSSEIAQHLR